MENDSDILILGSTGFIGNFLSKNLNCVSLSRNDVNFLDFDSLYKCIKKIKPKVVVNCASNVDTQLTTFKFECFHENLTLYNNIYKMKDEFEFVVHFGSGAEFDRSSSIDYVKEYEIFKKFPKDHYGFSKNIISRNIYEVDNFYNLRLFGCFHGSEKSRLLYKVLLEDNIILEDKLFDYFWLNDVLEVINYYLNPKNEKIKDLNLVYKEKYLLSEFVNKFLTFHNIQKTIKFKDSHINYTGSSKVLDSLNLNFGGIEKGIKDYFK